MIDLNHGATRRATLGDRINELVDAGLARADAARPPRRYLGASALGGPCDRRIQLDFLAAIDDRMPKLENGGHAGRTFRIFSAGHYFEDLTIRWLTDAGFVIKTRGKDGGQFGFSVAGGRFRGHVDGVIVEAPAGINLDVPCLWEHKALGAKAWQQVVKSGVAVARPVYAAQVATYQAYLELTENPALFTALNKDTQELYHELLPFDGGLAQRTSDRAVTILRAVDAGELVPRPFQAPDHHECRRCVWRNWCWNH